MGLPKSRKFAILESPVWFPKSAYIGAFGESTLSEQEIVNPQGKNTSETKSLSGEEAVFQSEIHPQHNGC